MSKLLTISMILLTASTFAQSNTPDFKKMLTDKSFIFVASASSAEQPKFRDTRERFFGAAPLSIQRMNALESKSSFDKVLQLVSYVNSSSQGAADKMSGTKNQEVPVLYLKEQNALFHASIFEPAFNQLIGRDPDSLNNPFALNNYKLLENKKGNMIVNFKVEDDLYDRAVTLVVKPDGKAEMTIATTVKRFNNGERSKQYYKGTIQELASL